jgi:thiol-disulfide isomerase/thioredoxin
MFSNFRKALLIAAIVALPSLARAGEPFDAKAFQASQAAGKSILVDVTAPWCPTCKQQRPIVQEIEKEHPDLVVYEVDFDTAKDVLYLPPSEYSEANMRLTSRVCNAMDAAKIAALAGSTWTTDAPFRETPEAIGAASRANILAVEMEAAALYAFAKARNRPVLCFAHVTNQLGRVEGDFEKGVADGAELSLQVMSLAWRWRAGARGGSQRSRYALAGFSASASQG